MNILLKAATVIDPTSPHHHQKVDIQITDGIITKIGIDLPAPKGVTIVEREHLHISQGWFDSSVCFGEPGYEERETITHGLDVAAASGFTGVALQPLTQPILDTSTAISAVQQKAQDKLTSLYPIGALTRESETIDLAELYDMQQAGAIAFGDYKKAMTNANLFKIALQYTQGFKGTVISFPQDQQIAGKGIVNEGPVSTGLGLKGIPAIAESLQIARDLHILEYTGGQLHIPTISTAASVQLIRAAKQKGLKISCSVAVDQLFFTDEVLKDFDTNFKVLPPLRSDEDRKALVQGLKDGTIDMVTSDHNPLDIEQKKTAFDYAAFGTIGLESAFGALLQVVDLETTIETLTSGRSIFGISQPEISEGVKANITLFNPENTYIFEKQHILSSSKNSPYPGNKLKGQVYGCIANDKLQLNDG